MCHKNMSWEKEASNHDKLYKFILRSIKNSMRSFMLPSRGDVSACFFNPVFDKQFQ